jgi:hypothetical protein
MICSVVGSDQFCTITASKTGYYPFTREFRGDFGQDLNFELTRK